MELYNAKGYISNSISLKHKVAFWIIVGIIIHKLTQDIGKILCYCLIGGCDNEEIFLEGLEVCTGGWGERDITECESGKFGDFFRISIGSRFGREMMVMLRDVYLVVWQSVLLRDPRSEESDESHNEFRVACEMESSCHTQVAEEAEKFENSFSDVSLCLKHEPSHLIYVFGEKILNDILILLCRNEIPNYVNTCFQFITCVRIQHIEKSLAKSLVVRQIHELEVFRQVRKYVENVFRDLRIAVQDEELDQHLQETFILSHVLFVHSCE